MWKATSTLPEKQKKFECAKPADEDDDWTDPDFTNDISEKDQRWGKQKTLDADELVSVIQGDSLMSGIA